MFMCTYLVRDKIYDILDTKSFLMLFLIREILFEVSFRRSSGSFWTLIQVATGFKSFRGVQDLLCPDISFPSVLQVLIVKFDILNII